MANSYHAIVIGGGHNGMIAAAYLAKAGARVVVCESRHKTGGAADTMAPWPDLPDFKVTTLSYVMSLMPDTILKDLRIPRDVMQFFNWQTRFDSTRTRSPSARLRRARSAGCISSAGAAAWA